MILLYVTWPDEASADVCAEALIAGRLAACVHILPAGRSVYRWRDAVARDAEHVMLVKTAADRADAARGAILARHPYELPCVIALPVTPEASHAAFLDWVASETRPSA